MRIEVKVFSEEGERGIDEAEEYGLVLQEAGNLFVEKNAVYQGAWRSQGYMGNLARILSKAARLKAMQWRDQGLENNRETVEDTLLDLLNLAVFAIINRRLQNKWGN